jgi:hypothetical protein
MENLWLQGYSMDYERIHQENNHSKRSCMRSQHQTFLRHTFTRGWRGYRYRSKTFRTCEKLPPV